MKSSARKLLAAPAMLILLSTINHQLSTCFAQGTGFTYQGQLQNNGALANGTFNLTFTLFNTNIGGTAVAGPTVTNGLIVSNGLFTVTIDFGGAVWNGETNWLEIAVETNGGNSFTTLSPRQRVTPTPYAITAENLDGTVTSGGLSGTYGNSVTMNNGGNRFTGTFTGNGAGLTNVTAVTINGFGAGSFWQLLGNTVTNGNFLGSVNNSPVEIHVNGQRAFLLEPSGGFAPNVIGGSPANTVGGFVAGATIGGGGESGLGNNVAASYGTIGGGMNNAVSGNGSFIGGGGYDGTTSSGNQVQAKASTLSGGLGNTIPAGADYAAVAGGENNTNASPDAVIGGGQKNIIQPLASYSLINGGYNNIVELNAGFSVIGGGYQNLIDTNNDTDVFDPHSFQFIAGGWSTVSGGLQNVISAGGSFIGGGYYNEIESNSISAVVFPNGQQYDAGWSSVVGGAQNTVGATAAFIGGGGFNSIQEPADWSSIAGGEANVIDANSFVSTLGDYGVENLDNLSGGFSFIGGGATNAIRADSSFIGSGVGNLINLSSGGSAIGGGSKNSISNSLVSFVGGGEENAIRPDFSGNSGGSAIVGGEGNTVLATSGGAFIGGGVDNTIDTNGAGAVIAGGDENTASGADATIPGGHGNLATGQFSFAAGFGAEATNDNSFVWAGGGFGNESASSTGPQQFIIGAGAGVAINTQPNTNSYFEDFEYLPFNLTVHYGISADYVQAANGIVSETDMSCLNFESAYGLFDTNLTVAVNTLVVTPGFTTVNGTFNNNSDRNAKQDFAAVSPDEILEKVAHLPVSAWSYKSDAATRHLGPMAQDFHAIFNLGTDERHIAPIDEGGVALAAIQGLNEKLEGRSEKAEGRIQKLEAENAELKEKNDSLEKRLDVLEQLVLKQR